jgi:hypothetical protein
MDRKENSRKRTQSAQRKFGLLIAFISQDGRWNPRRSKSLFSSLRSFAPTHFEREAWRTMATAVRGGVTRAALGAFPGCVEPRAPRDSRRRQIHRLLAIGYRLLTLCG